MGWSGGTYTKGNSSTGGWTGDASLGIGIEASRHDTQDNDFATGINQCLNKDGSNSATGNLNLGLNKITNMAIGTVSTDAVTFGQAQAGIDTQSTTLSTSATRFSADTTGPILSLRKSRGVTVGTNTIVQSGDQLGSIYFSGANGTGYDAAAAIIAGCDNTPGASGDMPGALSFQTTADGSGTLTERMVIKSSGRIGMGVGSPSERLDISGNLKFPSSGTSTVYAYAGNNIDVNLDLAAGATGYNSNGAGIRIQSSGASSDGAILFATNLGGTGSAERMRVSKEGRLGIGTNAPSYQLQLSADSAAKPTTNTWTIASDERIKTNIQPYAKGLEDVCKVNPVTYDYNGKGGIAAGPGGVSILAQELQPVFPECVGSYKAKLNDTDEEETDILNYNGHAITFALINSVKELNAKIEALEARIAELEG